MICAMSTSLGSGPRRANKTEEFSRPVQDPVLAFAGGFDEAGGEQAAAEGVLVHRMTEDTLVNTLQLAQREPVGEQLEADGGVVELAAQALDTESEHARVVEGYG